MDDRKMTMKERMSLAIMADCVKQLDFDAVDLVRLRQKLPHEWHEIALEPDWHSKNREKVTIRVNRDVVKYLRAMGGGYGERMNKILTAYVHGRLSKIVNGPDTTDFVLRPEKVRAEVGATRPGWGESSWWDGIWAEYQARRQE